MLAGNTPALSASPFRQTYFSCGNTRVELLDEQPRCCNGSFLFFLKRGHKDLVGLVGHDNPAATPMYAVLGSNLAKCWSNF